MSTSLSDIHFFEATIKKQAIYSGDALDPYNDLLNTLSLSLSLGVGWASGINLYAALLTLGLMGATGNIVLPEPLQVLQTPLVIGAAGLMYIVEFFADKTPGVDTGWDVLHTFVRIPAPCKRERRLFFRANKHLEEMRGKMEARH